MRLTRAIQSTIATLFVVAIGALPALAMNKYQATPPTLNDKDGLLDDLIDAHGNKWVIVDATNQAPIPVSAQISSSALATGAATSAKQDTGNTSLATIATNTTGAATAAAQATALTALNMLTMPRTTTTVTPSDSTDLTGLANKGCWVGTAGDVAVKGIDDTNASTLKNVASGSPIFGNFKRIMSTNTTATNIVCYGGTG